MTLVHAMWYVKTKGLWYTFKLTISKIFKLSSQTPTSSMGMAEKPSSDEEVLNLKPGELVEVKSQEEILATLDENKKNKGLLWMAGMQKYCGKKFKVFKRLESILLESNGEYRKMTRLACYVADQHVTKYCRDTIEDLVETVGCEVADDFYIMLSQVFDINVDEIREWIEEFSEE